MRSKREKEGLAMGLSREDSSQFKTYGGVVIGPRVPRGLASAVEGLAREILRHRPENIYLFAASHFEQLLKLRDQGYVHDELAEKQEARERQKRSRVFEWSGDAVRFSRFDETSLPTTTTPPPLPSTNRSGWSVNETAKVFKRREKQEKNDGTEQDHLGQLDWRSTLRSATEDVSVESTIIPSRRKRERYGEDKVGKRESERTDSSKSSKRIGKTRGDSDRFILSCSEQAPGKVEATEATNSSGFTGNFEKQGSKEAAICKTVGMYVNTFANGTAPREENEKRGLNRALSYDESVFDFKRTDSMMNKRRISETSAFFPAVKPSPCRLPHHRNESRSDSNELTESSASSESNGSKQSKPKHLDLNLTLPPITSDAFKPFRRENSLTLPALSRNHSAGQTRSSSIENERTRSKSLQSVQSMSNTQDQENFELNDNDDFSNRGTTDDIPSSLDERVTKDVAMYPGPRDINEETAFKDSLNVTPDLIDLSQRPDSLESQHVEQDEPDKPDEFDVSLVEEKEDHEPQVNKCKSTELKSKLIEIETVERNIERVLGLSKESTADDQPNNSGVETREHTESENRPSSTGNVTTVEIDFTNELENTADEEEGKEGKEGKEENEEMEGETEDPSSSVSGRTSLVNETDPFSYVLTEGSPCEIPESVVTVIIPERSIVSNEDVADERELSEEPFGEYVRPSLEYSTSIDVHLARGLTIGLDGASARLDLAKINEEDEKEDEKEEDDDDDDREDDKSGSLTNNFSEDSATLEEMPYHQEKTMEVEIEIEGDKLMPSQEGDKAKFELKEGANSSESSLEGTEEEAKEKEGAKGKEEAGYEFGVVADSATECSSEAKELSTVERSCNSFSLDTSKPYVPELDLDSLRDTTASSSFKTNRPDIVDPPNKRNGDLSFRESEPTLSLLETLHSETEKNDDADERNEKDIGQQIEKEKGNNKATSNEQVSIDSQCDSDKCSPPTDLPLYRESLAVSDSKAKELATDGILTFRARNDEDCSSSEEDIARELIEISKHEAGIDLNVDVVIASVDGPSGEKDGTERIREPDEERMEEGGKRNEHDYSNLEIDAVAEKSQSSDGLSIRDSRDFEKQEESLIEHVVRKMDNDETAGERVEQEEAAIESSSVKEESIKFSRNGKGLTHSGEFHDTLPLPLFDISAGRNGDGENDASNSNRTDGLYGDTVSIQLANKSTENAWLAEALYGSNLRDSRTIGNGASETIESAEFIHPFQIQIQFLPYVLQEDGSTISNDKNGYGTLDTDLNIESVDDLREPLALPGTPTRLIIEEVSTKSWEEMEKEEERISPRCSSSEPTNFESTPPSEKVQFSSAGGGGGGGGGGGVGEDIESKLSRETFQVKDAKDERVEEKEAEEKAAEEEELNEGRGSEKITGITKGIDGEEGMEEENGTAAENECCTNDRDRVVKDTKETTVTTD